MTLPCVVRRWLELRLQAVAQPDDVASPIFAAVVKKVKHTAGGKSEQVLAVFLILMLCYTLYPAVISNSTVLGMQADTTATCNGTLTSMMFDTNLFN